MVRGRDNVVAGTAKVGWFYGLYSQEADSNGFVLFLFSLF